MVYDKVVANPVEKCKPKCSSQYYDRHHSTLHSTEAEMK